jgi:hypothetical protein
MTRTEDKHDGDMYEAYLNADDTRQQGCSTSQQCRSRAYLPRSAKSLEEARLVGRGNVSQDARK